MLPKFLHILLAILLIVFAMVDKSQSNPLPRVNEHQFPISKVPQYHCLRYFKHDLLMMRRCRHLHVPTAPRQGEARKFLRLNERKQT